MPRECVMRCAGALRLFKFPDRNKQRERWAEWIRLLGADSRIYGGMYACQRHFSVKQYHYTGLTRDAVPDSFLNIINVSVCNSPTLIPTGGSEVAGTLLTSTSNDESSQNCCKATLSCKPLLSLAECSSESCLNQSTVADDSMPFVDKNPLPDNSILCLDEAPSFPTDIDIDTQATQNLGENTPIKLKMLQEISYLKRKVRDKDLELKKRDIEIKKLRIKNEKIQAVLTLVKMSRCPSCLRPRIKFG